MAHVKERQNRHDLACPALAIGLVSRTSYAIRSRYLYSPHIRERSHSHATRHLWMCAAVEVSTPTVVDLGCRLLHI